MEMAGKIGEGRTWATRRPGPCAADSRRHACSRPSPHNSVHYSCHPSFKRRHQRGEGEGPVERPGAADEDGFAVVGLDEGGQAEVVDVLAATDHLEASLEATLRVRVQLRRAGQILSEEPQRRRGRGWVLQRRLHLLRTLDPHRS